MRAYLFQPSRDGVKSRLWSAGVRLDEWPREQRFPLHVTDKRVAEQKLRELVIELERESHGVGIPRSTREAWKLPLAQHHTVFLKAGEAARLSPNTLAKYRHSLPLLFSRCRWQTLRDVTAQSFVRWREASGLSPKTVNDLLGSMRTFLLWMKSQRLIMADPLAEVRKVSNPAAGSFRRALSVEEAQRLLTQAPPHRALVYLTLIYTGLRRSELNGLKWGDFDFSCEPARLRVPSSLSKNRREATLFLRPELTRALLESRPADAKPDAWVFRGTIPRVPTLKSDLKLADIPFQDARGRRIDLHALRKTYGTMLAAAGVSPRVAMEMMRHSDLKLTMGVYTDVAQLPVIQETARLPSLCLPRAESSALNTGAARNAAGDAAGSAAAGVFSGRGQSPAGADGQKSEISKALENGALRHEKAPQVVLRRFPEMERAKRLELSTSTLARWCSTN